MASYFEWRYVVEEEVSPDIWRSTSSHDSQEQAVKVAKDSTRNSRVRQFKTTVFLDDPINPGMPQDIEHTMNGHIVPLVTFFCPVHQEERVQALATSCPRCQHCHQEMFKGEGLKL